MIRRGVRVFFREKEKQGKVRLQPDERAPPGWAREEVTPNTAEPQEFGGGGAAALPRAPALHFGEGRRLAIC